MNIFRTLFVGMSILGTSVIAEGEPMKNLIAEIQPTDSAKSSLIDPIKFNYRDGRLYMKTPLSESGAEQLLAEFENRQKAQEWLIKYELKTKNTKLVIIDD